MPFSGRLRRCLQLREPSQLTSHELLRAVMNIDRETGQRCRVLPVVMRTEQQFLATAEQDPNVSPGATTVAAIQGIQRPGAGLLVLLRLD